MFHSKIFNRQNKKIKLPLARVTIEKLKEGTQVFAKVYLISISIPIFNLDTIYFSFWGVITPHSKKAVKTYITKWIKISNGRKQSKKGFGFFPVLNDKVQNNVPALSQTQ